MRRTRWIAVLAGVVATSALGVPAASAADDRCLTTPSIGWWYGGALPPPPLPILTTGPTVAAVFITNGEPFPDCSGTTVTAQKIDGTLRRTVPLDTGDSTGSPPQVFAIGFVPIPLANGAGDWVVTGIQHAGGSLAVSVPFRIYRGTSTTLQQPPTVYNPGPTTLTGTVGRYTPTGARILWAGRAVSIYRDLGIGQADVLLGTVRTDVNGRYTARIRISGPVTFRTTVDATGGYAGSSSPLVTAQVRPRPATITGSVGATSDRVIRAGTKMSTYGHLQVRYTTGHTGPFAHQQVLIQTRPRGQTSVPYSTVASAVTTSTGYYYTNWLAQSDVDVRAAYVSPYMSIASAYRWLSFVDVQP